MADKIAYRFTGKRDADGMPTEYLGGVPAVSLTEADFEALTPEQQDNVKASSLYRAAGETAPTAAERRAEAAPAESKKE